MGFRLDTHENVVLKGIMKGCDWKMAAKAMFNQNLNKTTIVHVKQIDSDTVEILKRFNKGPSYLYSIGGAQTGLFERVTINRNKTTVAVDRMDGSVAFDEPYVGLRDLFLPVKKFNSEKVDFCYIRHVYWVFKTYKYQEEFMFPYRSMAYKRQIKKHSSD
jgi:hypothetical protein